MSSGKTNFPAVRACLFDMDGLLINSEDIITRCLNKLLDKYDRPAITRSVRVRLMGVPDSTSSDDFHDWANLPVPREQFTRELSEETKLQFTTCEPLPGADMLLSNLSRARDSSGHRIELALASSSEADLYHLKSTRPDTKRLLDTFAADRTILGDDPRIGKGRGKPAPDIYLVALQVVRVAAGSDLNDKPIQPDECLVFEDSIAGLTAARRAGMRVIWVPHPDVVAERQAGQGKETMASRLQKEWQPSEHDNDWIEIISNLEDFDYGKYGLRIKHLK